MWTPFKLLNSVVESYIIAGDQQNTNLSNLEIALRKHKQNFTSLLKSLVWQLIISISFFLLILFLNVFSQKMQKVEKKFATDLKV
jgi:large-conductance mechanosensitive channel